MGRCPPQPVSVLRPTSTPSPSFLLAQAIFEPTFSSINTLNILKPSHSSYLCAYEDGTECSETSAYKIQTLGNYPEESIQLSLVVVCMVVVLELKLRQVIHLLWERCYHLSLPALSFHEHSQVRSPWRQSPCIFWLWSVVYFLNNVKLFRAVIWSKSNNVPRSISWVVCTVGNSAQFGVLCTYFV